MKPLAECKLYAFVDTAYLHGRTPEVLAQQLCDGGADLIQLRAKECSPEQIRRMTEAILPITRSAGVGLVINDHLSIATEFGAEFCHLGQEDFFDSGHTHTSEIRNPQSTLRTQDTSKLPNPQSAIRIGLSTHSPAQAERALKAEPDYIAIGPVFATATKPGAKAVTLDYVRWAAAHVKIPWFAIGGINLNNLGQVIDAGAQRICVVSAILNAENPAAACREFKLRILAA
jgi:thiamine-phosphate pyrophosphorylase